jgi:hypothetical protein
MWCAAYSCAEVTGYSIPQDPRTVSGTWLTAIRELAADLESANLGRGLVVCRTRLSARGSTMAGCNPPMPHIGIRVHVAGA